MEDLRTQTKRATLRAGHSARSNVCPRHRTLFAVGKLIVQFSNEPLNAAKKRELSHSRRCNCSPICRKRTWQWDFPLYGDNDFEAALKEFEIAQRDLPNEAEGYLALGAIQRRLGKWPESTDNLEKAVSLNPKDSWVLLNLALNYQMLRNFDAANKTVDRGLKLNPGGLGLWEIKSKLAFAEKGDLSVSERAFQAAKSMPMNNEDKLRSPARAPKYSF